MAEKLERPVKFNMLHLKMGHFPLGKGDYPPNLEVSIMASGEPDLMDAP